MNATITTTETPKLQYKVPQPRNKAAEMVIQKAHSIEGVLADTPSITAEQFMVAAVAAANGLEKECGAGSVAQAVFNAATLGLMFGATRGHAYLVPFFDKKKQRHECQLIVGYQGFLALAYRQHYLDRIEAEVVLEGEPFDVWADSDGRQVYHEMSITRNPMKDGKNVIGAYCQFWTRSGARSVEIVSREELMQVRSTSPIWGYAFPPMARKSAIRKTAKLWPLTEQMALAVHLDEMVEVGKPQPSALIVEEPPEPVVPLEKYLKSDESEDARATRLVLDYVNGEIDEVAFEEFRATFFSEASEAADALETVCSSSKNKEMKIDSRLAGRSISGSYAAALKKLILIRKKD